MRSCRNVFARECNDRSNLESNLVLDCHGAQGVHRNDKQGTKMNR